ncbi:hypothetical protein ABLE91_01095 [Aquabacter sp. CN5-332]|uniref:hypothetical protein n=1 Tax=Aquabacter sp. CN5-332 TaxID=3156608 RepID=UPI0032B36D9A
MLPTSNTASLSAIAFDSGSHLSAPAAFGDGQSVTVNTGNATILTTGANAHGIFAQSVGSGGGIWSSTDGASSMRAGTSGGAGSNGTGGSVTVTQAGTLVTTGAHATGIFAQSTGMADNLDYPVNGVITVNVNGYVSGGSGGGGWGVWVDSTNSINAINIGAGGLVRSESGQAIQATGVGHNNVYNSGTVVGSYWLKTPLYGGSFNNQNGGVLVPQGTLRGDLNNAGMVFLASVPDVWARGWKAASSMAGRRWSLRSADHGR